MDILARERLGQEIGVRLTKSERRQLEREHLDILVRLNKIREQRVASGEVSPDEPLLKPVETSPPRQ